MAKSRTKFREPAGETWGSSTSKSANNIMFDKRVIRGNTYAAQILPVAVGLARVWKCFHRRCTQCHRRPPTRQPARSLNITV